MEKTEKTEKRRPVAGVLSCDTGGVSRVIAYSVISLSGTEMVFSTSSSLSSLSAVSTPRLPIRQDQQRQR